MTTRSTYGRRLGAVALGVGSGLLAYGIAVTVTNPSSNDDTTTEASTSEDTGGGVSGTDAQGSSAPTVAGITVTREQRRPVDDADDYSLIIIGAGLAVAGGASLRLSNRGATAVDRPYRSRHLR
jgi:hypothetical protein